MPFKILGCDDYGRAHFLGSHDRMWDFPTTTLTKIQLLNLASLNFWREVFGYEHKVSWDNAINYVIQRATEKDFNPLVIRGRGAWREKDGRICYHTGEKTIGKFDSERLYIRKSKRDIGILDPPIDPKITKQVDEILSNLTFETELDKIRLLAWSTIAPFAGALPWRPAILLTGPSASGKSTIVDLVIKPLSAADCYSGGETTEPGVRQRVKNDSCPIIIEESETDTMKKKGRREDLFSLMRQSTSDDAPVAAKGTSDGRGIVFALRSMFLFVAINPEVEHVADEKRIFRVNLKLPDNIEHSKAFLKEYQPALRKLLNHQNCRCIRALTWKNLHHILEYAVELADTIQEVSKKDSRYALAEGILQATYWTIWRDKPEQTIQEFARRMLDLYEKTPPSYDREDDAEELLDKILEQKVIIENPNREVVTLREILVAIHNQRFEHQEPAEEDNQELYQEVLAIKDLKYLRGIVARNGVKILDKVDLAVDRNSEAIRASLKIGIGYYRTLLRHKKIKEKNKMTNMAGKSRRCIIIGKFFKEKKHETVLSRF